MIQRHIDDVAGGSLKMPIDKSFALRDAAKAHAYIESRQALGRVVLVP
jgi:NADPH2:quinone reductase